jgi:hypothetical protein
MGSQVNGIKKEDKKREIQKERRERKEKETEKGKK